MGDWQDGWRREVRAFLQDPSGGSAPPELLLFQLDGALDFVTQARSAADLWSGACLLAWLMSHAVRVVADEAGTESLVSPSLAKDGTLDAPRQGAATLPYGFFAVVPAGQGRALAEKAEGALRAELARIGGSVIQDTWDRTLWDAQVRRFPRVVWATHAWQKGLGWAANYTALEDKLVARGGTYDFDAWLSKGNEPKDSLSGIEEAIAEEDGKRYGALNLIKRNWWKGHLDEKSPRPRKGYLAVLALRGNSQPGGLRAEGGSAFTPADHLRWTEALARFPESLRQSVGRCGGDLISVSGGDVLAIVPAKDAIPCAQQVRRAFRDMVGGEMSCGIVMGHSSEPFQMLLAEAFRMRDAARRNYDRAAMSIALYTRDGEIIEWGCVWESAALELMETVMELSREQKLSNRYLSVLTRLLQPYGLEQPIFSGPVILAEFAHVLARQGRGVGNGPLNLAMQYLHEISKGKIKDFLNLFLVGDFLNRIQGGR
ncbi:MAG: hypothetical protein FWH21_06250 [Kiritimatiellaeota bacterium]|nr:hypothetical protein [Kiritimatiellota bacterium]